MTTKQIRSAAETGIKEIIKGYNFTNNAHNAENRVMDDIQSHLFCCGAKEASDWDTAINKTGHYPYSCCSTENMKNDTLHYDYCLQKDVYQKGIQSLILNWIFQIVFNPKDVSMRWTMRSKALSVFWAE